MCVSTKDLDYAASQRILSTVFWRPASRTSPQSVTMQGEHVERVLLYLCRCPCVWNMPSIPCWRFILKWIQRHYCDSQSPFWFCILNHLVLRGYVLYHVALSRWCIWIALSITSNPIHLKLCTDAALIRSDSVFSGLWHFKINQCTPQFYWLIKLYSCVLVCYSLLRHH